ncbi:galactokinase [Opitutaceae bacterium TAV3]|nr:galactokinase [Opitutaceae bacterium TAV3]
MKDQLIARFKAVFGREPQLVTRAPGRIEFIGNHTDYNGGTVLGASINRGVWIAIAPASPPPPGSAPVRRFHSTYGNKTIELDATSLTPLKGADSWINYPLGILSALPHFGLKVPAGFDYLDSSDLPAGAGLSSSAAIELSSALAFLGITGQDVDRETLVKIGKYAENNYVGVPCGILDQGVSGFGKKDHLVFIDCRGPKFDTVPIPAGVHFWIFNTHTKHALVDGLYAARNRECMTAAAALGVSLLHEVTPAQVLAAEARLGEAEFKRARHVTEEIARVDATKEALAKGDLATVGKLLVASHRSSQHLFENSTPELDFLVDTLEKTPGVYGARLSGGGFGGAVMAMTGDQFNAANADQVAAAYAARFGARPDVLHMQTGPGAAVM